MSVRVNQLFRTSEIRSTFEVMSNAKFECVSDSANSRLRAVYYNDEECTDPSAEAAQEFVSGECLNFEDFSYKIYFDCVSNLKSYHFTELNDLMSLPELPHQM